MGSGVTTFICSLLILKYNFPPLKAVEVPKDVLMDVDYIESVRLPNNGNFRWKIRIYFREWEIGKLGSRLTTFICSLLILKYNLLPLKTVEVSKHVLMDLDVIRWVRLSNNNNFRW